MAGVVGFIVAFIFTVIGGAAGFGLVTCLVGGSSPPRSAPCTSSTAGRGCAPRSARSSSTSRPSTPPTASTLTQDQAIRRWLFLFGPYALTQIIPIVGFLLGFLVFFYALYLLYTASQSPKRQGFHDVQANTVVIKRVGA